MRRTDDAADGADRRSSLLVGKCGEWFSGGIILAIVTTDRLVYLSIFFGHFCDWLEKRH